MQKTKSPPLCWRIGSEKLQQKRNESKEKKEKQKKTKKSSNLYLKSVFWQWNWILVSETIMYTLKYSFCLLFYFLFFLIIAFVSWMFGMWNIDGNQQLTNIYKSRGKIDEDTHNDNNPKYFPREKSESIEGGFGICIVVLVFLKFEWQHERSLCISFSFDPTVSYCDESIVSFFYCMRERARATFDPYMYSNLVVYRTLLQFSLVCLLQYIQHINRFLYVIDWKHHILYCCF